MNLRNIHLIRGVASLIVVIYHAKFVLWCGGSEYVAKVGLNNPFDYFLFSIDMLSSCGKQAVIAFFLLSSIVITHSFKQRPSLKLFFKIRILRIYIPFIASIFFSGLILRICGQNINDSGCALTEYTRRLNTAFYDLSFSSFLNTLFFISEKEYFGMNFAYWSLLHEAIFYLLFPIYIKLKNHFLITLFIILIILSQILNSEILYYQSFFLLGISIYNIFITRHFKFGIKKIMELTIILVCFVATNLLVKFDYHLLADLSAIVLFIFSLLFLVNNEFKIPVILKKLSDQSYSLYLFHLPILMAYFSILHRITKDCTFYSRWPYYSGVILALLLCIPIYYLFEYQSQKLISKIKHL